MNYKKALHKLQSTSVFGMQLGLDRIKALLQVMNNPQEHLKFVHIAGTNGKGSTSTMLSTILQKSGYQTGLFISPYVLCFRERMQVNGQMISEHEFTQCAQFVYQCIDTLADTPLTQFEIETAIAFEWFHRKQCNIICLEVGLGGRFDATNVIASPLIQIITAINLDHTSVLGNTLEQVAFEKAGIIKGGTTISYPLQDETALRVLEKQCHQYASELIVPSLSALSITNHDVFQCQFTYKEHSYQKSLPGEFQVYNSITAIEAATKLATLGFNIPQTAIQYGIEHAFIPARLERIHTAPLILLDGAHNPHSAKALYNAITHIPLKRLTIVMGVLSDKEYESIVSLLAPLSQHFVAVSLDNPRALSKNQLAETAKQYCDNISCFEDIETALSTLTPTLTSDDCMLVCGSLYLASNARPILLSIFERN